MRHFCTYFDRHYLVRGLALYRSLKEHAGPFTLWVLCFDEWSYDVLTKLAEPDLRPIALADFERDDPELLAVSRPGAASSITSPAPPPCRCTCWTGTRRSSC